MYDYMSNSTAFLIDWTKIRIVLWDVDGTILNFFEAQKNAIRSCFDKFALGQCTDSMLMDYDGINHGYWKALERGEITKREVLSGRFKDFFEKYGIGNPAYDAEGLVDAFNEEYQVRLGDTICYYPGVREIIDIFKDRGIIQFAVTNGTKIAQERKLSLSGLDRIFDAIFISEDVGFEKPNPQFFTQVLEEAKRRAADIRLSEILIIGDSLTSDMRLGDNVGIGTCWFNYQGMNGRADSNVRVDLEINSFDELMAELE